MAKFHCYGWIIFHSNILTYHNIFIHSPVNQHLGCRAQFILMLNDIASSVYFMVYLSIPLLKGHLGCFRVVGNMNKGIIISVYKILWGQKFSALLDKYQGACLPVLVILMLVAKWLFSNAVIPSTCTSYHSFVKKSFYYTLPPPPPLGHSQVGQC